MHASARLIGRQVALPGTMALLLLAGWPGSVRADDGLIDDELLSAPFEVTPLGEVRVRGQLDASRDLVSEPVPAGALPIRGVLGALVTVQDLFGAKLALSAHSRLGTPEPVLGTQLDEGYVELRLPLPAGQGRLRLGRQAVQLLDGRLVGSDAFLEQPRRLDAVWLQANSGPFVLDAMTTALGSLPLPLAVPVDTPRTDRDYLAAVVASWSLEHALRISAFALGQLTFPVATSDDPGSEVDEREGLRLATLGAEIRLEPISLLRGLAGLGVQLGERGGLEHQAVDLWLRLEVIGPWKGSPTLYGGFDHSGGDLGPLDNRSGRLSMPVAARHTRYGAADLLDPANAQDLYAGIRLQEDLSRGSVSVHRLALASSHDAWRDIHGAVLLEAPGGEQRLLGHEIDVKLSLSLAEPVSLQGLYALFLPDGVARQQVGTRAAHRILLGLEILF